MLYVKPWGHSDYIPYTIVGVRSHNSILVKEGRHTTQDINKLISVGGEIHDSDILTTRLLYRPKGCLSETEYCVGKRGFSEEGAEIEIVGQHEEMHWSALLLVRELNTSKIYKASVREIYLK